MPPVTVNKLWKDKIMNEYRKDHKWGIMEQQEKTEQALSAKKIKEMKKAEKRKIS